MDLKSSFISRPVGILLVICFFMPFLTISCSGQETTVTGYELATGVSEAQDMAPEGQATRGDANPLYFLFPTIGILVVVASFMANLSTLRTIYIACGALGLGFMLFIVIDHQNQLREIEQQGVTVRLIYEMGWWLALLGFAALLFAAWLANKENEKDARDAYDAIQAKIQKNRESS